MIKKLLVVGFLGLVLAGCKDESDDLATCGGELFNTQKKTAYLLEEEPMILKRATTQDTSFLYLEWKDENGQPVLFIFDQNNTSLSNSESRTHFNVSGEVKISCPNNPTINDMTTSVINVFRADKIDFCPVSVDQSSPRPLEQTYWRFIGFRSEGEILPPTCEENFLYIVFTNSQVNPVNPDDRYYAEIYNGVQDCLYIYRFLSPTIARVTVAGCFREDIAATKGSRQYGQRFLQGLLDPDAIYVTHNGSNLVIRPENLTDEMVFVGL